MPRILILLTLILVGTVLRAALPGARPGAAQGRARTFPETGQTVRGEFLAYWASHGGLAQQGYPISGEMQEVAETTGQSYTVQYFERAVFEHHPDNPPPSDVLLALLGTWRYRQKYPLGRPSGVVGGPGAPPSRTCVATHDDSDVDAGRGFIPAAPQRQVVGQGFVLTGRVLSSRDCAPIAGVQLELRPEMNQDHPDAQRATLYTDASGRYRFESNFPEHIHMRVAAHGFQSIIANGYHTTPGKNVDSFDIVLVPDPACRWFAETGQALCGPFLEYWTAHGALPQQGYPLSDEFTEVSDLDGKPYRVQYFERAVFEHHPENAPPYAVLLAQLGTLRYRAKYPPAGRIIAAIPMPAEPVKIALGGGVVWVATTDRQGGGSLVRLAAATGRTVGDPEPVGFEPHDLSVGEGGVWVSQQETVARFDPTTGKRTARIPIQVHSNYVPILAAAGSVWVADPAEEVSTVLRIDAATNRVVGPPIKVGQEPLFLVAGAGAIWAGSHDSKTIARIDPRTRHVSATVATGFEVHGLAYGEGALWVANYHGHAVVRVDPAAHHVVGQPTNVGYAFEAIAAAGGAVWTAPDQYANDAVKGNDNVTRIDARTGAVLGVVHVGGTPNDVSAGDGQVWVAITRPNVIVRILPADSP
jgi:streptogramin lyase